MSELLEVVRARQVLPTPQECQAIRKRAGVSRQKLADAIGVSRETLRLWEVGKTRPYDRHIVAYSNALNDLDEVCA